MVILTDSEKTFGNYSLCNAEFKTLKRETEEDTGRCKDFQCSGVLRIHVIKTSNLLNVTYKINTVSKIPMPFLTGLENAILKFIFGNQ